MSSERTVVLRAIRRVAVLSALTGGILLGVLFLYIVYVYALWTHAMRAEGAPGIPPP